MKKEIFQIKRSCDKNIDHWVWHYVRTMPSQRLILVAIEAHSSNNFFYDNRRNNDHQSFRRPHSEKWKRFFHPQILSTNRIWMTATILFICTIFIVPRTRGSEEGFAGSQFGE